MDTYMMYNIQSVRIDCALDPTIVFTTNQMPGSWTSKGTNNSCFGWQIDVARLRLQLTKARTQVGALNAEDRAVAAICATADCQRYHVTASPQGL
jgi:hypothetical protein